MGLEESKIDDVWSVADEQYERCRCIGRGGFSKVLAVKQMGVSENRYFALKVMSKRDMIDKKHTTDVFRERWMLIKAQSCPFVVRLYRAFQTKKDLLLLLQFLPGGDLRFHLAKNRCPYPTEAIRFWTAQLTLALESLHSLGIIHRDIKAENVVLDAEGNCHLVDFTGAVYRQSSDREKDTSYIGTSHYMAPEILAEEPNGFEVDWWSLGILLLYLATCQLPFRRELKKCGDDINLQHSTLLSLLREHGVHISSKLDPDLADLIAGLLNMDPAKRFTHVEIKAHPFMKDVNWEEIWSKKSVSPFKPPTDTINFDPELELHDMFEDEEKSEQTIFDDWNWENPAVYGSKREAELFEFFKDAEKMTKGITLYDVGANRASGRIFFSIEDIPVNSSFETENGVLVSRPSKSLLKIGSSYSIEI